MQKSRLRQIHPRAGGTGDGLPIVCTREVMRVIGSKDLVLFVKIVVYTDRLARYVNRERVPERIIVRERSILRCRLIRQHVLRDFTKSGGSMWFSCPL